MTTRGTCRDCGAGNVGVCGKCRSHCECHCSEPTYASLGLITTCCGSGDGACYCNEEA